MEKNIQTLARYLLSKGINSSVKLQKMLFFFRVEDLKKGRNTGYFKENYNFQAWIYGPVNKDTFKEMRGLFLEYEEEIDPFILEKNEIKEIDRIYGEEFDKYVKFSPRELVRRSHANKSWINARNGKDDDEPCENFLEEDESFTTFIDNN